MNEYISRDAVLSVINNMTPKPNLQIVRERITKIPAADVAEVKHEHWYIVEYEYFNCSGCRESYYDGCESTAQAKEKLKNGEVPNFCPNCGAKMDGGIK